MASLQESRSSPQLQIPRDSPSSSVIKSPSQFSAVSLLASSSPSPSRKRLHPNYLKIDDAAPPNKKLNTPTQEEKETLKKEKEMLYKRLAEEKRTPFYLTPFPIPLANKFSSISPSMYSLFQQQQQQPGTQAFPSNITLSPSASVDLSHAKLAPNLTSSCNAFLANSPGSNSSLVGSTAGISGLPTPGGSSVGTPPRSLYPQMYPQLLRFPFSPPTPSSIGLPSPWYSNRSMSVSSSVATPGGPPSNESLVGDAVRSGSASTENNSEVLATSTPRNNPDASPKKQSGGENVTRSPPKRASSTIDKSPGGVGGLMMGITPGTWVVNVPGAPPIQPKPHLKMPHPYIGLGSIQSPLGIGQAPYSPAMQGSTYPGSVSSCPSVSSSSGCSSASENQEMAATKNYILSEYHVGPHRLISEKDIDNQSEEATTSGRNTPVDPVADDDGNTVTPSEVADKLLSNPIAGQCYSISSHSGGLVSEPHSVPSQPFPTSSTKGRPRSSKKSKSKSPYPFSVESCCQQPSPQGYLPGIVDRPSSGVSSMSSSLSSRDSTPDPEEMKGDPSRAPQGLDTFCLVPGRLSLLSSTQRYKVTVDEVRRRLSHPECLNASVLGGILRRAKSKNGGTMLRQRLQEIGVMLPSGRRKQTELSLLTALVESESLHLAGDFHRVCDNYFPHAELGQIIARQHVGTPEAQHRVSMVKATQVIVSELQAMLEAVGGPSNIRPNDPNNPYPGLTNFSLISHGFGPPTLNTGLGVLQTYLQELLAYYEGKKPIQAPENRYSMMCEESSQASPSSHGMGTGLNPDSSMHGNLPQHHHHNPHHPLQNPLLHATRHYPSNDGHEPVASNDDGGTVDVTFKEEPAESPKTFTT